VSVGGGWRVAGRPAGLSRGLTPPLQNRRHHSLVDVNYAENHLPLDYLFGTFAGDEQEAEASIARRFARAGEKTQKQG